MHFLLLYILILEMKSVMRAVKRKYVTPSTCLQRGTGNRPPARKLNQRLTAQGTHPWPLMPMLEHLPRVRKWITTRAKTQFCSSVPFQTVVTLSWFSLSSDYFISQIDLFVLYSNGISLVFPCSRKEWLLANMELRRPLFSRGHFRHLL